MTVGELRDILEDFEDDAEVRFAAQPSWPLEYTISHQHSFTLDEELDAEVLYLTEGRQVGYLDGYVRGELGWM